LEGKAEKSINRAVLAGVVAALMNEHTHFATDSAGALWQMGNRNLYPQRMKSKEKRLRWY
jgi:hypothetical protein